MKFNIFKVLWIFLPALLLVMGCQDDFLDKKPRSAVKQPSSLEDFQALLDHFNVVAVNLPCLPLVSADEYYYLSKRGWESTRRAGSRNAYVWATDVFGGEVRMEDWNGPYAGLLYLNSVISNIDNITPDLSNQQAFNEIKGAALLLRAYTYYELVKNFAASFDENTADTDLGVPLRLDPAINYLLPRSTVRECYNQIHNDLDGALSLLLLETPNPSRNRASKLAAYAFAARLHLSKREYEKAGSYADTCLRLYPNLIDYNNIDITSTRPFDINNEESILRTYMAGYGYDEIQYLPYVERISIDSNLLRSYHDDDLRFQAFFQPNQLGIGYHAKIGYSGQGYSPYNGLAVDEMYLIKAECAVRAGDVSAAMEILNALLVKRYRTGTFVPLTVTNNNEALAIILNERRKELVWRGLRWDDLKRLNKEGANITLTRNLDGDVYTLLPNDPRYVFNIPADEIALSGIEQNIR